MKIAIETGGDKKFCGTECPFIYGNRFGYACKHFRDERGKWRKLRTNDENPKRCKPCVERLVIK